MVIQLCTENHVWRKQNICTLGSKAISFFRSKTEKQIMQKDRNRIMNCCIKYKLLLNLFCLLPTWTKYLSRANILRNLMNAIPWILTPLGSFNVLKTSNPKINIIYEKGKIKINLLFPTYNINIIDNSKAENEWKTTYNILPNDFRFLHLWHGHSKNRM